MVRLEAYRRWPLVVASKPALASSFPVREWTLLVSLAPYRRRSEADKPDKPIRTLVGRDDAIPLREPGTVHRSTSDFQVPCEEAVVRAIRRHRKFLPASD